MVRREVALYKDKLIGIESIFTVNSDGKQINIPEKVNELRAISRRNELFCPCGCGENLILVAPDNNTKAQHFRIKHLDGESKCTYTSEGKTSRESKIILKCWLDDKLRTGDIESRIPISETENCDRKFEYTLLSKSKGIAISYSRMRENLSSEKISILENNNSGTKIIYVADISNSENNGQYPENLMKIQSVQSFCLLLSVTDIDYDKAELKAVFYSQDIDRIWNEVVFAEASLKDFDIDENGEILLNGATLNDLCIKAEEDFEKKNKAEENKRIEEKEKRAAEGIKIRELIAKQKAEEEKRKRRRDAEKEEERWKTDVVNIKRMETEFDYDQNDFVIRDANNVRWAKCKYCKRIASEGEFSSMGGKGSLNLGVCRSETCMNKHHEELINVNTKLSQKGQPEKASNACPNCGGRLIKRNGKYGEFLGCSNYPKCKYTRDV